MDRQFAEEPRAEEQYAAPVFMTKDGYSVVNRLSNHISGMALYWLPDAIPRISVGGENYVVAEIEYPTEIACSVVVPTEPGDDIVWAQRLNRTYWSRCVRNRPWLPTRFYTAILKRRREDPSSYIVISAWIGSRTVDEEDDLKKVRGRVDPERIKRAQEFWNNHAFVLRRTPHWEDTVRTTKPEIGERPPPRIEPLIARTRKDVVELSEPTVTIVSSAR